MPCKRVSLFIGVTFEKRKGIFDFKLSPCTECCMLFLGDSPASEFYMPTFRDTLSSIFIGR